MKTENILTIIVFLIIFLGGFIAPRFVRKDIILKSDRTKTKIAVIESAINKYKLNTNKKPGKLEDLIICPEGFENVWQGPCLKPSELLDSWDRPYIYDPNKMHNKKEGYYIISYGKDGKPGGDGENKDLDND